MEKALQHKPADRFSSPEELVKHIKKARANIQKGRGRERNQKRDSDTQPLDSPPPLSAWVAVALVLLFLGVGSYAVYEVLTKGIGG